VPSVDDMDRGRLRATGIVVALLVGAAGLTSGSSVPSTAADRAVPLISLSPRVYIAGEPLAITGSLGVAGRRAVVLQRYMRDHYIDVERGTTDGQGRFRFTVPGPGMATPYSVLAPSLHRRTGQAPVSPAIQDVHLDFTPSLSLLGSPVQVRVSTFPARAGRTVELQRRTSDLTWKRAGLAQADARGVARFVVRPTTEGAAVYRAVAGRMRGRGIDWFPSFPTYLPVVSLPLRQHPLAPRREGRW